MLIRSCANKQLRLPTSCELQLNILHQISASISVAKNSHCPYARFYVGTHVETYVGTYVENQLTMLARYIVVEKLLK